MKLSKGMLYAFCGIVTGVATAGEVVLFSAETTPLASVSSHQSGQLAIVDGMLEVKIEGDDGYPGVLISGQWDLSGYNLITCELECRDRVGSLPLTIRLDNPDANPGLGKGVFIDRLRFSGEGVDKCSVAIAPQLPSGRAITSKFSGMRATPFHMISGVVADLDKTQVVGVALYMNMPGRSRTWRIKRITAHKGEEKSAPAWTQMSEQEFFPFVDKYGQFKFKEWPGKINSDEDLQAALKQEEKDLTSHPGPDGWNKFGGWTAGPRLKATGHFRVEKVDGVWWMVDPEGCLYWSHGPVRVTPSTAITPLDNREFYFEDLPDSDSPFAKFYTTRDELLFPYYEKRNIKRTYDFSSANCYRKYGANYFDIYADLAHRRLRSWGLNTIANSSDKRICLMKRTPYTDRFELKSKPLAGSHDGWWPFRDPFDPSFREDVKRLMNEHKIEMEDPWCFGFFVDNELSWGGECDLAAWTLESPANQVAKSVFRERMRKRYGTIEKLNAGWGTAYTDWEDFLAVCKRPSGKGADDDLKAFTIEIADAYFRIIREEFKAAAPDKLYMGCRFATMGAAKGPDFAIRVAAKYCDILSYNIYGHHLDSFKLPQGIDKPVMIGEFHFGARDRGLFHPGLIELKNQDERERAYVRYVTSALENKQIVGVHWHQFGDQATTGRFDGENFQVGFVDCCDTPYPETIRGIREVGYRIYEIRSKDK